jgi:hypothetical protein
MTQAPAGDKGRLFTLIQVGDFESDWTDLGLDNEDLRNLENAILSNPEGPPIIAGTGGARKVRFAPAGWNVGKSGAIRVIYVFFEEFGLVLMLVAYAKNEQDNLSPDQKRDFKNYLARIEKSLKARRTRNAPHP